MRKVSGADERGYIIRSGLDVLLRFCSFRSLCFLGNATLTPLVSMAWFSVYTEERDGFALRTVCGSNFSLGTLSRTDIQRTFEIDEERKR